MKVISSKKTDSFDFVLNYCRVSTVGTVTESKLKDRITFGARLLSRDGRDELRELFVYFHTDQSLNVYE